jgi:hypothetical protein
VTRLGVFSPMGRRLALNSVLKITEVKQIFGLLFSNVHRYQVEDMFFYFDKNGLGYISDDFFTNPSGHPERDP